MVKLIGVLLPILGILLIFCGILFSAEDSKNNIGIFMIFVFGGLISMCLGEYVNNKQYKETIKTVSKYSLEIRARLSSLSSLNKASVFLSLFLLMCFLPLSHAMYTLIRFATSIIMVCWAYVFLERRKTTLAVISGSVALLFQPFVKVYLDKLTWNIIDVLLAVSLIALVFKREFLKS